MWYAEVWPFFKPHHNPYNPVIRWRLCILSYCCCACKTAFFSLSHNPTWAIIGVKQPEKWIPVGTESVILSGLTYLSLHRAYGRITLRYCHLLVLLFFIKAVPLRPRQNGRNFADDTFKRIISWMKMLEFGLNFHWSLFGRVELTIFQHWFR